MKILVVDDEKDVQLLFQQRFRREIRSGDMDFVFAFSGEEALQIMEDLVSEATCPRCGQLRADLITPRHGPHC